MTVEVREPPFSPEDFGQASEECDIVMKGGVTSGMVYPYAVLELATKYHFRSIGGTSAGGIAAAFAAAAEFARRRGDPGGFKRLEARCLELPDRLATLFQPAPRLKPLMAIARGALRGGLLGALGASLANLWGSWLVGAVAGGLAMQLLSGGIVADALGAALGVAGALALRLQGLVRVVCANGFGMCSGLTMDGRLGPGLTDWLYASLQEIAYGSAAAGQPPLTFGDLWAAHPLDEGRRSIDLRMMTTNLSMKRPHALPELPPQMMFEDAAWERLFPGEVMSFLRGSKVARPAQQRAGYRFVPKAEDFPVLVAVRMSLSFPILFSAIPLALEDIGAQERADARLEREGKPGKSGRILAHLWFTDGGLSSNFPIHFFDSLLPQRPTFALSLDDLPSDASDADERVSVPTSARSGLFLPLAEISDLGGFLKALLNAAKDWQDQLLSTMPGQRERIARVSLSGRQGGLNMDMPPSESRVLMGYGIAAGKRLLTDFDFDEHRWRRGLATYQQLERACEGAASAWAGGYGAWFKAYKLHPKSYRRSTGAERDQIEAGLEATAGLVSRFTPPLRGRPDRFPKPYARLRGVPDV